MKGQVQNRLGSKLMQEIAAYVDSNITMDYLETAIDWETGEINLKVKKKYFNKLTRKTIKYIKSRHYVVLAYAYLRMREMWKFFTNVVRGFFASPISFISILFCR
jgi:hypothetical protein